MGCNAAWARRVRVEILSTYPDLTVVPVRAYGRVTRLESGLSIPAVEPADGDPIRAIVQFLRSLDDPAQVQAIAYSPRGGFSFV